MLKKLVRQLRLRFLGSALNRAERAGSQQNACILSASLDENLKLVRQAFQHCSDVVTREFTISLASKVRGAVVFVDGLVDKTMLQEDVMRPLMVDASTAFRDVNDNALNLVRKSLLTVGEAKQVASLEELVAGVLAGGAAVLIDGFDTALLACISGWEARSVEEPQTEVVVRGPREGFVEVLRVNTSMLRRRIHSPDFKIEEMTVGRKTNTKVAVAYIKGLADEELVREVKRRLARIDIDAVLESGYIEAFIEDAPFSPFITVGNSERPDPVAAKILEGRVAILVDGTPFALTVPYLFLESFQVSEDYYSRPYYATLIRWIRFVAFFFSVLLPAFYVAFTTYHQELVPSPLLFTLAAAREGVPFPAALEALIMELVYEVLREAGVRLPRPIGQAVSIVGALVIGEAAVSAGLIGAPLVIVVALTAISSFVIPAQSDVAVILRLAFIIMAGVMGLFGVMIGIAALLVHLCALRSFGIPYFYPLAPLAVGDLKDTLIRAPLWAMARRPKLIGREFFRQKADLRPRPRA